MAEQQANGIKFRTFLWSCVKESIRGAWEKADWVSSLAGAGLGATAYFLPSFETQLTRSLLIIPLALFASVIVVRLAMSPFLVYRKRDTQARITEEALHTAIADRDHTIRTLTDKPKRTVAEQHHYETAVRALRELGPDTATALRHLKTHGTLTFGTYYPQLPVGMRGDQVVAIYITCVARGLVTQLEKPGSGEKTFAIAPTMNGVLDELLYEDGTSAD